MKSIDGGIIYDEVLIRAVTRGVGGGGAGARGRAALPQAYNETTTSTYLDMYLPIWTEFVDTTNIPN